MTHLIALCENCDTVISWPEDKPVKLYCSATCRQRAYEKRHGIVSGYRRGWVPNGLRGKYLRTH